MTSWQQTCYICRRMASQTVAAQRHRHRLRQAKLDGRRLSHECVRATSGHQTCPSWTYVTSQQSGPKGSTLPRRRRIGPLLCNFSMQTCVQWHRQVSIVTVQYPRNIRYMVSGFDNCANVIAAVRRYKKAQPHTIWDVYAEASPFKAERSKVWGACKRVVHR